MRYYVRRHDGKTYGPYDSRHESVGKKATFHDSNEYEIEATEELRSTAVIL